MNRKWAVIGIILSVASVLMYLIFLIFNWSFVAPPFIPKFLIFGDIPLTWQVLGLALYILGRNGFQNSMKQQTLLSFFIVSGMILIFFGFFMVWPVLASYHEYVSFCQYHPDLPRCEGGVLKPLLGFVSVGLWFASGFLLLADSFKKLRIG